MAKMYLQGTEFALSILPNIGSLNSFWARTELSVQNEYVRYSCIDETISREELNEWIVAMFRLLAGAYGKEYNLSFEKAGLAVDLYPHTDNGNEVEREKRRKNDCIMIVRLLMRSQEKKFLGGVYSFMFHREEIEKFATEIRAEYDEVFARNLHGSGQYHFVGVSPRGYRGCNYWYLDPSGTVEKGDYVWVCMGRHNREQIVYVDSVKDFEERTAPYNPKTVKQVLRKATKREIKKEK